MSDPLFDAAVAEKEANQRKIDALVKRNSELDGFMAVYPTMRSRLKDLPASSAPIHLNGAKPTETTQQHPTGKMIVKAVTEILTEKAPRKTRELLDQLESRGMKLEVEQPISRLSQILSREKDLFVPNRKRGWKIKRVRINDEALSASDAKGFDAASHN